MMRRRSLIGSLVLVLTLAGPSVAQTQGAGEPIVIGVRRTLPSAVLGEDRQLLIYTPPGYGAAQQSTEAGRSAGRFPVIYVLDGSDHFHHTTGLVQYLSGQNLMSPAIVVAILNTDRTRDLSPPLSAPDSMFPTAGGAGTFLRFLREELIPYIDREYRTEPYRMLIGHSFGGLFAVYALMEAPDLFQSHIAISPSLWWDNEAMLEAADAFFDPSRDHAGWLYMTMGNEGGAMIAGAWGLERILETQAPASFQWEFQRFEREDHGSVPLRSTYAGLEAIYAGWRVDDAIALAPGGDLSGLDAHYAALSARFGYDIATPESVINSLGYQLLRATGQVDAAITVFEENVRRYPESANVYDSLGDAYEAAGRITDARDSYARAVATAGPGHPNLGVYRANLMRMEAVVSGGR